MVLLARPGLRGYVLVPGQLCAFSVVLDRAGRAAGRFQRRLARRAPLAGPGRRHRRRHRRSPWPPSRLWPPREAPPTLTSLGAYTSAPRAAARRGPGRLRRRRSARRRRRTAAVAATRSPPAGPGRRPGTRSGARWPSRPGGAWTGRPLRASWRPWTRSASAALALAAAVHDGARAPREALAAAAPRWRRVSAQTAAWLHGGAWSWPAPSARSCRRPRCRPAPWPWSGRSGRAGPLVPWPGPRFAACAGPQGRLDGPRPSARPAGPRQGLTVGGDALVSGAARARRFPPRVTGPGGAAGRAAKVRQPGSRGPVTGDRPVSAARLGARGDRGGRVPALRCWPARPSRGPAARCSARCWTAGRPWHRDPAHCAARSSPPRRA